LSGAVVNYPAPVATDTLSGVSAAGVSCAPAAGTTFAIGATTVNCSVKDVAGNSTNTSFVVTVADQTPPVIAATLTGTAGLNGWYTGPVAVAWSVTDAQSAITSPVCASVSIATNGAGQLRSCIATSSGGTATVNTPLINIDTVAPVFGISGPISQAATSLSGAVVNYPAPVATDTLSGVSAAGVSCAPAAGTTFAIGATTVNCSVKDVAGNSANTSFVVTVADQTPPVIAATLTGTAGLNGWYTSPVAVAWSVTDAQSAITSPVCASVNIATNGASQLRTCVATSSGGTATVNTPLINIDTVAPTFTSCPARVSLIQGQALPKPAATDNLSTPVVTGPISLALGTTPVTWKATDAAGLSASCLQQVTVTAAISETIGLTTSQCKRVTATTGQWNVQGTSTNSISNAIQLYVTATVPASPFTASTLGAAVPVASGKWLFQTNTGPACTTPISLRSSAAGIVKENILVAIQ
jgi:ribosomal protein S11